MVDPSGLAYDYASGIWTPDSIPDFTYNLNLDFQQNQMMLNQSVDALIYRVDSYQGDYSASTQDVNRIQATFHSTVNDMTVRGLRHSNPTINNQQRFWGRLTDDLVGNSCRLDCGEQTEYMNNVLQKQTYDDNWTFYMNAGTGHAWGLAISSNPADPTLHYDTRSGQFSKNVPCPTCRPWYGFGGSEVYPAGSLPPRPQPKRR